MKTAVLIGKMLLIGVVAGILVGCGTVDAGHRGIVTHWGKVDGNVDEGLHFYNPVSKNLIPIDCRTHKIEQSCSAASHDLQTVSTTVALNYRLDPDKVDKFYQEIGYKEITVKDGKSWSYVSKVISPRIDEVLKSVTAEYTAEELITKRPEVKGKVEKQLKVRLKPYHIIVTPNGVSLTDFNFSDPYNDAIEAKQVAEQDAAKKKYELEQEKMQKQIVITKAEGEAQANALLAKSLTQVVLASKFYDHWDGKLPQAAGDNVIMAIPGSPFSPQQAKK